MRRAVAGFIVVAAAAGAFAIAPQERPDGGNRSGRTPILEAAPTDRAIAIPGEKLAQYLRDMDARGYATLRMIEGGKYNVNIRRIRNAETALAHPNTIDLWVVLEGGGTLTTGGRIEGGKIIGGESNPLRVGDVSFIPAGLPHGVSGVNGTVTWLNVRWDVDWPADAEPGAGRLPNATRTTPPMGRGAAAPLAYAPTDRAVYIPRETLDAYRREMDAKNLPVLRMIEGGRFNVNIRRITSASAERHPITIDTWVMLQGTGTVSTGFDTLQGKRVAGTGVDSPAKPGDVFFIPAALYHGMTVASDPVAFLNIRWDVNWAAHSDERLQ